MMTFPFQRNETSTFGALRAFEKCLSIARQSDAELSKEWRVPISTEVRKAAKIREETYAIMLLADKKVFDDAGTFRLTPEAFPNIDAELSTGLEAFQLQITIADPIWCNGVGNVGNGGYDFRLTMEVLNDKGIAHGLSSMSRLGSKIFSNKPVKSYREEFDACVRGIEVALHKKIKRGSRDLRLLVETRGYGMHTIDFSFESVIEKAFDLIGRPLIDASFGTYYFVDEAPTCFLEYSI